MHGTNHVKNIFKKTTIIMASFPYFLSQQKASKRPASKIHTTILLTGLLEYPSSFAAWKEFKLGQAQHKIDVLQMLTIHLRCPC